MDRSYFLSNSPWSGFSVLLFLGVVGRSRAICRNVRNQYSIKSMIRPRSYYTSWSSAFIRPLTTIKQYPSSDQGYISHSALRLTSQAGYLDKELSRRACQMRAPGIISMQEPIQLICSLVPTEHLPEIRYSLARDDIWIVCPSLLRTQWHTVLEDKQQTM